MKHPHLYVLDVAGEPLAVEDVLLWAQWFETADRQVAFDRFDPDCVVSTIFLGIDYNHFGDGPPLLYETMVFGGPGGDDQARYTTRQQALAGHRRLCTFVRRALLD